MKNSSLAVVAVAVTGIAIVAIAEPASARSHKRVHGTAPTPAIVAQPSDGPQFIRVGPNGYWVTTTWGCWVDDGQGRIHDCEGPGGGSPW